MFKISDKAAVLAGLALREVSRGIDGVQHLIRCRLEMPIDHPGNLPFARAAATALLQESKTMSPDDGPNTAVIRLKRNWPLCEYRFRIIGGDGADRVETVLAEVNAAIDRERDKRKLLATIRRLVLGSAREVSISGSVVLQPEYRIVEGVFALVWQVEASVSPDVHAALGSMKDSDQLVIDIIPAQQGLDLDGIGERDPDAPEEKKRGRRPRAESAAAH